MSAAASNDRQALIDAARGAFRRPFDAVVKVAPDDEAPFAIDGRKDPPVILVDPSAEEAGDITFYGAPDVLLRVFSGERALENAYVSGRLGIAGDMSVMARLALDDPN